ncbi:MAG TPA: SDR family oxidoreductase [Ohtaekwangia sp.]|nr:SDR family oxidoreductase [Ohtaekwangia sp.]
MDLNLNGKRALVCGSTQGIGKATAIELALAGAHVTLVARDDVKLKAVVKELQIYSGLQHDYIVADFNDRDDLKNKVEAYVAHQAVHILVNNTGGPPAGPAMNAGLTDFTQAFSNHLLCNQILVQAVVSSMMEARYGRIINIISTSVKAPIKGLGVSNTIRGAVANWAKTLSFELGGYGITVNNVLPGATMTARLEAIIHGNAQISNKTTDEVKAEMIREIPAGRIADPAEVAAAIAFLASPAAAYINGINLPVDGGRTPSL